MRRLVAVGALSALAVAVAVLIVVVTRDSGAASIEYRGSLPPEGFELPSFALPDETGRTVRSEELSGKVVLVTFLDTQCEAECPIVAPLIGQGLRRLDAEEREHVVALALSSDPPEDTPERVADFLDRLRVRGLLRYLVAPVEEMEPIWRAFAVTTSYETGIDDLHSIPVRIFDTEGSWVSTLNAGADLTPANLAHDVRAALQSS